MPHLETISTRVPRSDKELAAALARLRDWPLSQVYRRAIAIGLTKLRATLEPTHSPDCDLPPDCLPPCPAAAQDPALLTNVLKDDP
jgi:hypothetical protein